MCWARSLLALSPAGRKANPGEDVDLDELVRDALAIAEGPIRERGVEVRVASALPGVHGDRPRLLEVLQNLIENSVKFMGQQQEPRIEISARSDHEAWCAVSATTGSGSSPAITTRCSGRSTAWTRASTAPGSGWPS
jgi:two-component system, LuxR family, sensor kinase FixL